LPQAITFARPGSGTGVGIGCCVRNVLIIPNAAAIAAPA
jgi:hypothetical protein